MDKPSLPSIPKIDSDSIEFPALMTKISPQPFNLLIFLAGWPRLVNVYEGELPRRSVSYDIGVTTSEKLGSASSEAVVINSTYWREFARDKTTEEE